MPGKTILFLLLLINGGLHLQAQSHKINGYIREAGSKESLVGASVLHLHTQQGTVSNSYGFYSFTLPEGNVRLQCSYLGYQSNMVEFELQKDTIIEIFLQPLSARLGEVVISSRRSNLEKARLGAMNVPVSQLTKVPALLGETDVLKALQLLPGVQSTNEGKSDFSVRGGSPDQNLIMLDGIPVYNANHVFGFLSIFNSDAIKNINFYKAGFPARFGGRLSSVVDIRTNDGNMECIHGSATIGLISAKTTLEGPLKKDKTSFNLSFRRTYIDLFMNEILNRMRKIDDNISENDDYNFFFYDINAKLHHKFTDRSSVFFMLYTGRDKLDTQYDSREGRYGQLNTISNQDWKWGSTLAAAKWNYIFSGNLFLNTTLSLNDYKYDTKLSKKYSSLSEYEDKDRSYMGMKYNSGILDYSLTTDLDYIPSPNHYIRIGTAYTYHNFKPEVISREAAEENVNPVDYHHGKCLITHEAALYAEDEWIISRRLEANPGVRLSMYNVEGKTYTAIDPRFSLSCMLSDKFSLKAGYTNMKQYIHLLSNNVITLQTDLWVPVTKNISPMKSHQYSAGLFYALPYGFDFSVEAYYKDMRNLLEYEDGASFLGVSGGWESKVEAGNGRNYGVEFFLQKSTGKTTGWISYTRAKNKRKFEGINFGEWFPAKYDRRHSLNITATQQVGKHFEISANWIYNSGNVITIPLLEIQKAEIPDDPFGRIMLKQFDHRNNYRMEAYHRMDIGVNYYTGRNKQRCGIWNVSLYNVYNRKNTFLVTPDYADDYSLQQRVLKKISLFPIIPSLSYTYKF